MSRDITRVELRDRLSNPLVRQNVRVVAGLVASSDGPMATSDRPAIRGDRRARMRDRLSKEQESELARQFLDGATRQELVERYGISLSSVKRVLRRYCAHR